MNTPDKYNLMLGSNVMIGCGGTPLKPERVLELCNAEQKHKEELAKAVQEAEQRTRLECAKRFLELSHRLVNGMSTQDRKYIHSNLLAGPLNPTQIEE